MQLNYHSIAAPITIERKQDMETDHISKDLFIYFLSTMERDLLKPDTLSIQGWREWCKTNNPPGEVPIYPGMIYDNWKWEEIQFNLGMASRTIRQKLLDHYCLSHNHTSPQEKLMYLQLLAQETEEHPSTMQGRRYSYHRDRYSYPYSGCWLNKLDLDGSWRVLKSENGEILQKNIESAEQAEIYAEEYSYNECLKRAKAINDVEIETLSDEKIKEIQDSIKTSTYLTDEFWEAVFKGEDPKIQVPNYSKSSRFHTGTKKELLKMAEKGQPRPLFSRSSALIDKALDHVSLSEDEENELCQDIHLSSLLLRLTDAHSELYCSEFDKQIRGLAPSWFEEQK